MATSRLRELLERPGIIVVPGGGSPLEMRLIQQAGFEAAYISGYAAAAHRYGVPDIGLVAFNEIEDLARECVSICDLPLIVDCDNGYGDVANVARTVRRMEAVGVAAVQIEDQAWPKRCGHMDGKIVIERSAAVRKIAAAADARRDSALVLIARTDARAPLGLDEAIERCHAFKAAGADVLFVDAPHSRAEIERIARELPGPLLINISESGKTPMLPLQELERLGIKIALYPSSSLRVAVRTLGRFYADLKAEGDSSVWLDRMATLDETNEVLGLPAIMEFERGVLAKTGQP
jgi:2-methylisocitrate lyase-like PEP mutase family enzyme